MTCPEERLVAFLAGQLSSEEERRFDEHLLACEQCWAAVQADRADRLALEQLRQPAPAGLQGRVAASVALAAAEAPKGPVVAERHLTGGTGLLPGNDGGPRGVLGGHRRCCAGPPPVLTYAWSPPHACL